MLGLALALAVSPAMAQMQSSDASRAVPGNGMKMDKVIASFGEPQEKQNAVGDPPITRWDYEGYSVFFEFSTVLHSVVHKQQQ